MTHPNHQLVRDFFTALSSGTLSEDVTTPDMTAWTATTGTFEKARFQGAVKILAALFAGDFLYTIDALTAEDDRVAAEVQSTGTFLDGERFHNFHAFMFRIRDGKIAHVAEHVNLMMVNEKIVPRMQAVLEKMGATL
jgi:uncharacterized protein